MGNKLIIRAYDVEVGDCIYVCIPGAKKLADKTDDFHMLIDCGTKGKKTLLQQAIKHLESSLPPMDDNNPGGKKRLDLIVVSHEHEDHIKGFDPEYFSNISVENIWLSASMDPDHPQAEGANSLHAFAGKAMQILASQGIPLSPEVQGLVSLYGIDNEGAMTALRTGLPQANDIQTRYAHADLTAADLGLELQDAEIKILGPENNIDRFYLGDADAHALSGLQNGLNRFAVPPDHADAEPKNISLADFRRLRTRMMSNALGFAELSSKLKNNTSLVLLIEWSGKRLLFVGDLEWESSFMEGHHNGGWNVMWEERHQALNAPIHFLKVGHHGSTNATPWNDRSDGQVTEPGQILDAILPILPENTTPDAKAIVSTKRKNYKTIPKSALLAELGKRVVNTCNYDLALREANFDPATLPKYDEYEKQWIGMDQPLRTDHEALLSNIGYVEVEIDP